MLILHSLTLKNVAGVDAARIELAERGVSVIYGPNEAGKTTLLKAFETLLRDIKVGSSAKAVQWMYPRQADVSPEISAEMTVGDYELRVTKMYKQRAGQATLQVSAPQVENLTGRQAEERLQEILSEGMDRTLRDALTIRQGESLETFVAADVDSLAQALEDDDAVDSAPQSADASSELLNRVYTEYKRYFTDGGAESNKGELRTARRAVEEAQEVADVAQQNYAAAQGHIEAIDQLTQSIEEQKANIPAAHQELEKRKLELAEAEAVEQKRQKLEAIARAAESQREVAESRVVARRELIADVGALGEKISELESGLVASRERFDFEQQSAREQVQRREAKMRELDESELLLAVVSGVEEVQERAHQAIAAHRLSVEIAELMEQRAKVKEALDGNPATPKKLASFRETVAQLRTAERFRDSVATSVHIDGPSGATIGDEAGEDLELAEDGVQIHVTSRRKLSLGEYTVTVTPSQDLSQSETDVQRATKDVDKLCAELGLESPELGPAESKAALREKAAEELQQLQNKLASKVGDRGEENVGTRAEDAAESMARSLDSLQELVTEYDELEVEKPHDLLKHARKLYAVKDTNTDPVERSAAITQLSEESGFDVNAAREEVQRWNAQVKDFVRSLPERDGGMSEVQKKYFSLEAGLEQVQASHHSKAETLSIAREDSSDEDLEQEHKAAAEAFGQAKQALEQAEQSGGADSVQLVREKFDGAEARVQQIDNRIQQLKLDRAQREGQLERGYGAASEKEEADRELKTQELALQKVQAQAAAAKLLHETIEGARAALRAQYEKPFKQAFESLAGAVFGNGTSFTFGTDLSIEKRVRGGVDIEADALSGGAQEQMMMLARLAVATLVGGGDSVPIFIDDALGFSDPHRMKSMNAVLGRLGRDHQIIVLTCDVDRFDSIAGAAQHSIESVKSV
ncbi:AAA family ATPase [Corynebacterium dentalis]|uniref:AAA family ATPase n=1 Tax=Corynebacterium dentalis TaxID=2014528 RepID=UPI000C07037B|nr:AAA family ATPase [Corynebacterium dentalis]